MKWSLDIHKYPSEKTRRILVIMRDNHINRSSSADDISRAEDLMTAEGLYTGEKGASGRIRRALFTYFSAYSCLDDNGELTEFGKLFSDGTISIKEFAFHYISNYRVGGGSEHYFYPLDMLLRFSKIASSIDPERSYITATDLKKMQLLNSIGELNEDCVRSILGGCRTEVQGGEVRSWNFDSWKNLLTSAGLFEAQGDAIKLSAPQFIVEWLMYAYSQDPGLEKGRIDTGVFSILPFEGLDNIVGTSLLKRANQRDGHTPWQPFDVTHPSAPISNTTNNSPNFEPLSPIMKNFIEALKTKPFLLLAGISGTGKSQKVKELAFLTCPKDGVLNADSTTPGNYCLIEVKPNWHDSTELLGYYSNLSEKYTITPFLHFVHKAATNPNVPFFVCLDEMNLAPVEQYFAEYLSVLETRTMKEGKIETAELLSKKLFEGCDERKEYTEAELEVLRYLKNNGLRLPENLFVIGTVNMDDTTYQFSRKVIDRAFTIEMNGDELEEMFADKNAHVLDYTDTPLPLSELKPKFVKANDALADDVVGIYKDTIIAQVPEKLKAINAILKDTPFRVSYRVQNEFVLYLSTLLLKRKDEDSVDDLINKTALVILLEKILPRVQGDEKLLSTADGNVFTDLMKYVKENLKCKDDTGVFSEVIAKLDEMDKRLSNTYFANFF